MHLSEASHWSPGVLPPAHWLSQELWLTRVKLRAGFSCPPSHLLVGCWSMAGEVVAKTNIILVDISSYMLSLRIVYDNFALTLLRMVWLTLILIFCMKLTMFCTSYWYIWYGIHRPHPTVFHSSVNQLKWQTCHYLLNSFNQNSLSLNLPDH